MVGSISIHPAGDIKRVKRQHG